MHLSKGAYVRHLLEGFRMQPLVLDRLHGPQQHRTKHCSQASALSPLLLYLIPLEYSLYACGHVVDTIRRQGQDTTRMSVVSLLGRIPWHFSSHDTDPGHKGATPNNVVTLTIYTFLCYEDSFRSPCKIPSIQYLPTWAARGLETLTRCDLCPCEYLI
jgi:hypothetical protein